MADLTERMTALARDLQSAADPRGTLEEVVAATMDVVEHAETCGITLVRGARRGKRRIETSASYDEIPTKADGLQAETGEGPCMDAIWEERVVWVNDLAREDRWPSWAPRIADEFGVRSMMCVRLYTHEETVGALNMFSSVAHAFTAQDREDVMAVAAHGAVAVAAAERIEHLQHAIDSRTGIAYAVGILMATYRLTPDQAFAAITRFASEQNRKVTAVAQEVLANHIDAIASHQGARTTPGRGQTP